MPPAHILAEQWPELDLETRQTLSLNAYVDLKTALRAGVQARKDNLANQSRRRRKRADASEYDAEFDAMMVVPDTVFGIQTNDGKLEGAESCVCTNLAPTAKVRKTMTDIVAWDPTMSDLTSEKFKAAKLVIEKKVG